MTYLNDELTEAERATMIMLFAPRTPLVPIEVYLTRETADYYGLDPQLGGTTWRLILDPGMGGVGLFHADSDHSLQYHQRAADQARKDWLEADDAARDIAAQSN